MSPKPIDLEALSKAGIRVLRLVEKPDGKQALVDQNFAEYVAPFIPLYEETPDPAPYAKRAATPEEIHALNAQTRERPRIAAEGDGITAAELRIRELEQELSGTRADHKVAIEGLQRALADERLNTQSADREAKNLRHDLEAERRHAGAQRQLATDAGEQARFAVEAQKGLERAMTEVDTILEIAQVPSRVAMPDGSVRLLTRAERLKTVVLRMARAELELGDLKAKAHAARIVGLDGQMLS